MKKFVIGVIALCLWACASVCSAAYMIHLKDGRDITTHEYWEEGAQIKIKQYGGVVGISKDDVVSIEEVDDLKTIVVKSPPETKPEGADEKADASKQKEDKKEKKETSGDVNKEKKPEKPVKEKASKEKNTLLKEFDALKKRFKKVENMSKEEIFQLDKDLSDLRNKILKAGLGGAYSDHLVALSEMGNKAEEVYKKRGQ